MVGFSLNPKAWIKGIRGQTFRLNADDIVVFVVGPSGGGKSWFVEEVTKSGLVKVGEELKPCTTKVRAIRCELAEEAKDVFGASIRKNIVFVDTPSFHTGTGQNDKAEKKTSSWLSKAKSESTLAGTIYLHRVETDPTLEPIQRHLNTFAYAFPEGFTSLPQRLHAVLSYEGVISEDKIRDRRANFQAQLDELKPSLLQTGRLTWSTSIHPNLFRQGGIQTAWQAVEALFSHSAKSK